LLYRCAVTLTRARPTGAKKRNTQFSRYSNRAAVLHLAYDTRGVPRGFSVSLAHQTGRSAHARVQPTRSNVNYMVIRRGRSYGDKLYFFPSPVRARVCAPVVDTTNNVLSRICERVRAPVPVHAHTTVLGRDTAINTRGEAVNFFQLFQVSSARRPSWPWPLVTGLAPDGFVRTVTYRFLNRFF